MNCLLYNDYAISQKYHNNGTLDFITSLIISLLSNVLTKILIHFFNFLTNYPNFIEIILKEIKNVYQYFNIIIKLFKIVTFKFILLFIFELLLGLFTIYYITIFSIVNSKSINSFLLNFLIGRIESLIYSIIIAFFIAFLKRISQCYRVKRLYIISEYINEHL